MVRGMKPKDLCKIGIYGLKHKDTYNDYLGSYLEGPAHNRNIYGRKHKDLYAVE